ncbi:Phosphoglycerate kinase [Acidimicrobium ferrooxidans DSM 10331]|uniref:Phosphoglycerate kinase n=1 Tax=Acidimicrobium ferrooxidans (strain DSM 10331 / JCM 15462 / NBRC 103882 / ICP) TaxID=525909 RepID=C7LYI8_ACIFD|nr:phosphoglycerate kinase [Acidimicrobium ferrooxidans]ACU53796.1 Phosphoglycerate kinase [Acidimicrobium ferrooxidans DSM 10331]
MELPRIEDLGDLRGRRVLVRADLNVPLAVERGEWVVADDFRIRAALPTVEFLRTRGADVTLCSHLGRPKGIDARYSMAPVAKVLEQLAPGVEVLENLRFDPRETANDPSFAQELAHGHDAFVLDAFGSAHRAHASVVGVPALLPSAAGLTLLDEVEHLSVLLEDPPRPYVAIVGGAKVSDKLGLLTALAERVDAVLVGGAMAFTFLLALGHEVGDSLVEEDHVEACRALMDRATIHLPEDLVVLESTEPVGAEVHGPAGRVVGRDVPRGTRGLDVGPRTVERFGEVILGARSILWNGPMGLFEDPRFAVGTTGIARAVAGSSAYSVVGGGDSARALREAGLADQVSHLSTGGGASLEFLEHGDLPGLAALRQAAERRP